MSSNQKIRELDIAYWKARQERERRQKPIDNRIPLGNAKLYHTENNFTINKKEKTNDYIPFGTGRMPNIADNRMLGESTSSPSQYYNINDDYRSADLLKAFKSNPYTQPLHSVA